MSANGGAGTPPAPLLKNIFAKPTTHSVRFGGAELKEEGRVLTPEEIVTKYRQTKFHPSDKQQGVGSISRRALQPKSPKNMENINYNDPRYEKALANYEDKIREKKKQFFYTPEVAAERAGISEKTGRISFPTMRARRGSVVYPAETIENAEGLNLQYQQEYNNNPFKPSVSLNNAYNALNEAAAGRPRATAHNYNAEPLEGVYSGSVAEFSAGESSDPRKGVYTGSVASFAAKEGGYRRSRTRRQKRRVALRQSQSKRRHH